MGKNLTIELDESLYQELERLAHEREEGLDKALAEALKTYLEHRKAYVNDPFFQIGKAGRSGLGDLAQAHDKYLYDAQG
jgi:metal-responsive CopG/Arc/MetJ family transcriptional regulator